MAASLRLCCGRAEFLISSLTPQSRQLTCTRAEGKILWRCLCCRSGQWDTEKENDQLNIPSVHPQLGCSTSIHRPEAGRRWNTSALRPHMPLVKGGKGISEACESLTWPRNKCFPRVHSQVPCLEGSFLPCPTFLILASLCLFRPAGVTFGNKLQNINCAIFVILHIG